MPISLWLEPHHAVFTPSRPPGAAPTEPPAALILAPKDVEMVKGGSAPLVLTLR